MGTVRKVKRLLGDTDGLETTQSIYLGTRREPPQQHIPIIHGRTKHTHVRPAEGPDEMVHTWQLHHADLVKKYSCKELSGLRHFLFLYVLQMSSPLPLSLSVSLPVPRSFGKPGLY
jgi:hypothetical protein